MGVDCFPLDRWDKEKDSFKEGIPYFRRNWFGWRPLWNFVFEHCQDLITEEQFRMGHSNCGDLLDKETCLKVSERIKNLKVNKIFPEIINPITKDSPDNAMETWYRFDDEDIKEFSEFLSKSDGLAIL